MYKDQFQNLEDILENALKDNQVKYFAYALSRVRGLRDPSPRLINLAVELVYVRGIKWVQILQRLAIQNYQLVFQICKQQYIIYPSLVNLAHPVNNQQKLSYLENKIFQLLQTNTANHHIIWCSFVQLIIRSFQETNQQLMLNLLNRINSTLANNHNFFDGVHQINNVSKESLQTIYSTTGYKVLLCVGRLYKSCCKILRRKLKYLLAKESFGNILFWIRSQYQLLLENGIGIIAQNGSLQTSIKQDMIGCLLQIQSFVQLQDISMVRMQELIKILLSYGLVSNNKNLDTQDRFNWQYGLICNQYGDDLPSHIAKTTIHLAKSLPCFLKAYVNQLTKINLAQGEVMMRYIIIHQQLVQRSDLVSNVLQPFLERVIATVKSYAQDEVSQLQFCRKIRLLMFYSQILKQKHFITMLHCVLDMLRKQNHASFCFIEGYNLMKQMIGKSNFVNEYRKEKFMSRTAELIKEKVPQIINTMLDIIGQVYLHYPLIQHSDQRQGKLFKLFQLFEGLLIKNQNAVQKMLPQVLNKFCYWMLDDIYGSWRRGVKSSGVINFLMRITKLGITLLQQDYYSNLQQPIYDVLDLLKNHNIKEYYQDLLQILVFAINKDVEITPRICFVIVELQRVMDYNKSMHCILNVVKALCFQKTAESILFNWPDLCLFLFNLFANYLNTVDQQYSSHYSSEWQQILVVFGQLIQVYSVYLQDNKQVTTNILYCLSRFGQNQIKLQLFLIMNHLKLVHNYQFYRFSDIHKLQLRNTFKLLCLYYCDRLKENYSQPFFNEFVNCYKIYQQKKHRKAFKPEIIGKWQCLQISTQIYISQCLKQLRKKGSIDSMEFSMFRRELDLSY